MDFAQQQRNPAKHLVGIVFVALLHILLIYALVNGLATKVIDVLKKPIETKIIEEVKPPPPPEVKLPPPPKMNIPPPPYIPPPEVTVQAPPPPISQVTSVPPPTTQYAPSTVTAPPAPKVSTVAGNCTNSKEVQAGLVYPAKLNSKGITTGKVVVLMQVGADGHVDVAGTTIRSSTNRLFTDAVMDGIRQLKCTPGMLLSWDVVFQLED